MKQWHFFYKRIFEQRFLNNFLWNNFCFINTRENPVWTLDQKLRIDMRKTNLYFFISWFIRVINLCVKVLGKSNALLKKIRRALNSRKVNALWKKNISIAKCTLFLIRMQLQFDLMFIFFVNNGEHNIPSFIGTWNRQPNCPTVAVYIIEIKYIEKAPLIVLSRKYINFH